MFWRSSNKKGRSQVDVGPLSKSDVVPSHSALSKSSSAGSDKSNQSREFVIEKGAKDALTPNQKPPMSAPGVALQQDNEESRQLDSISELWGGKVGKIRSAIGVGTTIEGKLSFDTPVKIDGTLRGDIYATSPVYISVGGLVEGRIRAPAVIVQGKLRGEAIVLERVEIFPGGVVEGELQTPSLSLHEGGHLIADCLVAASDLKSLNTAPVGVRSEKQSQGGSIIEGSGSMTSFSAAV